VASNRGHSAGTQRHPAVGNGRLFQAWKRKLAGVASPDDQGSCPHQISWRGARVLSPDLSLVEGGLKLHYLRLEPLQRLENLGDGEPLVAPQTLARWILGAQIGGFPMKRCVEPALLGCSIDLNRRDVID
jgi:hypothetical protein